MTPEELKHASAIDSDITRLKRVRSEIEAGRIPMRDLSESAQAQAVSIALKDVGEQIAVLEGELRAL